MPQLNYAYITRVGPYMNMGEAYMKMFDMMKQVFIKIYIRFLKII